MKGTRNNKIAIASLALFAVSLAIAACNPTYQNQNVEECSGPIGSGQRLDRITWTCCNQVNKCTNGAPKRFYRTADIYSNSITGKPCWQNNSDGSDQDHPCCRKPLPEEPN